MQRKPSVYIQTASTPTYNCKTTLEYDGMLRFDVSFHSSTAKPFILKKLRLIIPIRSVYAKYLHYYPGIWGTSSNSFGIKGDWNSPFRPLIFIADEEKGLCWFTETDENFHLKNPDRTIELKRQADKTFLVINILDVPKEVSSYNITFGIQATPVRPVPVAWWLNERICHWGYYGMERAPASSSVSITYPAEGNINPMRGSLQAWVRVDFDAQEEVKEGVPRGDYNRNFLALYLPNGDVASLYWNIDDRGMRFYAYDAQRKDYPIILGAPAKLDKGWHHIALSWGREIKIFVDGVQTAGREFNGLFGKDVSLEGGRIVLGGGRCEMAISQFAIYDKPLESVSPIFPLTQENALLWDSYDRLSADRYETSPSIGKPGMISGLIILEDSPNGKALCLWRKDWQGRLMLDVAREMGARTIVFHEHWTDIQNYTETTHSEELRALVEALHRRGMRLAVYFGYEMSDIAPEFPFYSQECLRWRPGQWYYTRQPEQKDYGVCYNSPWADFLADGMEKVLKKYDIDGVYLDGTASPMGCDNTLHGCGYYDEKGNLHPTYPIFAVRDLMKRIYTICYHHRPKEPFVNVHNSTYLGPPTLAFATSYWDGEQFAGVQRNGKHPLDILPLDSFRCEFMGHNIGVPADFLVYERNPFT
ncbi:MAG: LamG-like jellyroll fold domain-containing protein, partial [bacterium]